MRQLVFELLQHVPEARELFEQGEAGDALRLLREAKHVKLSRKVQLSKEDFLYLVLTALTPCSDINTYQSDETLV